jgi:hypothetical protein
MKECLKAIILAGATATAALALSGCVTTTEVRTYSDPWYVERPLIVERHYPLGYPVIEYRVYPHHGFHNPHMHFHEAIPHVPYRIVPMPSPKVQKQMPQTFPRPQTNPRGHKQFLNNP